jgi:hypothetical protein
MWAWMLTCPRSMYHHEVRFLGLRAALRSDKSTHYVWTDLWQAAHWAQNPARNNLGLDRFTGID